MRSLLFLSASAVLLISILFSVDLNRFFFYPSDADKLSDDKLSEVLPITGAVGPESFAFDRHGGGPYTGVSDGRIIKWQENERRWIDFAVSSPLREGCQGSHDHDRTEHICGRPLGLHFNERTGDLYIADAYMGLLVVGPDGGLANKVATQAQVIPFRFTNALDIDQSSGVVYFTDSSSRYHRRNYISVIVTGDNTGRLIKYDLKSKEITVLLDNLSFPNGVALSENGHFILVAETTNCRILKLWLETSKVGTVEVFAELPGFADNIKRNPKGEFWVGIHSRRGKFLKWILSYPWIGNALVKLPFDITKAYSYLGKLRGCGLAVRLSDNGDILEMLEDKSGHRSTAAKLRSVRLVNSIVEAFVRKGVFNIQLDLNGKTFPVKVIEKQVVYESVIFTRCDCKTNNVNHGDKVVGMEKGEDQSFNNPRQAEKDDDMELGRNTGDKVVNSITSPNEVDSRLENSYWSFDEISNMPSFNQLQFSKSTNNLVEVMEINEDGLSNTMNGPNGTNNIIIELDGSNNTNLDIEETWLDDGNEKPNPNGRKLELAHV
ncbi:hypothetical protein F0562_017504 [Nyssa sinensis]|uniref:Strictosidine synthase conserved region domain-containing protein n=1 Tax=Nyssa sinensis TaxID=561372 RepID=A0A5J4ZH94_9ASTE|nr:hypothetical protein F0562_017504 [Nyssa sinensis]